MVKKRLNMDEYIKKGYLADEAKERAVRELIKRHKDEYDLQVVKAKTLIRDDTDG